MRWPATAFQRTGAQYNQVRACTHFAHAASQLIDVERESLQSIIGATHNRCDKLFICSGYSALSRSNQPLERLIILSPRGDIDRYRWAVPLSVILITAGR